MANELQKNIRTKFGAYLKKHREEVLKQKNLLHFSYTTNLDNSKLAKIEKGEVDIRLSTLLEIAEAYKLSAKGLLGFSIKEKAK